MKITLTQIIIGLVSFIVAFEFLSELNSKRNHLNINDEGYSYENVLNSRDVYFVGDSFASTNYVNTPYPLIFRDYFKSKGMNFFDYSRAGTELNTHKIILDSISLKRPELIIYFYNISDVVSLNKDLLIVDNRNVGMGEEDIKSKKNKAFSLKNILVKIYKSHTSTLFKKAAQYISLKSTGKYLKGTPSYNFPIENKVNANTIEELFDSIDAKNVIILVNTPFNAHPEVKNWEHYKIFRELGSKKKYKLFQAVDIIDNSNYAVSWRNDHPNQDAIRIIANHIIKSLDEFLCLKLKTTTKQPR